MRNWQGEAAGRPDACRCGQPPAVEYTATLNARVGWRAGPRDLGRAQRYVPVYRCGRHQQNPPPGYTPRLIHREEGTTR